jgi:hypothetical protein
VQITPERDELGQVRPDEGIELAPEITFSHARPLQGQQSDPPRIL